MFFYGLVVLFVYLLLPQDAYAWGPGAHMTYALHALANLAVLAPPIRFLLKKYPHVFLYGTIAADIIIGKKFAGELYHCHHWDVAFSLLNRAREDRERAFMYGYLGHLAVDTVAHNYYVPYKIIASYEARTLRHTYWEMRFDQEMDTEVWKKLEEVAQEDYLDLDKYLEGNLKRSVFSFSINKKIFNSLMILTRMKKWRQASSAMAQRSSYSLSKNEVKELQDLCFEVLLDFFQDPTKARALQADPSGQLKLLYAKEMVKDLRNYTRRQLISKYKANRHIENIRVGLEEGIYREGELPLITDALH